MEFENFGVQIHSFEVLFLCLVLLFNWNFVDWVYPYIKTSPRWTWIVIWQNKGKTICYLNLYDSLNIFELEGVPKICRLTNCPFTTIWSQFFAIYINIFHKTEVQTGFLGAECVYIIGSKVMTRMKKKQKSKKCKNRQKHYMIFFTKSHKNENVNNCVVCHNF